VYTTLDAYELWALTDADLAQLTAGGPPLYLLVEVASVETQWAALSPGVNYAWLRDGPGLTLLGVYDDYQLFAVRCACP
jgi:hypothetical protein